MSKRDYYSTLGVPRNASGDAIKKAIGTEPSLPKELKNIMDKKEKMNIMSNNTEDIKNFILNNI